MLDITKFNKGQLREIYLGRQREINTTVYENPKFTQNKMKEIREGLEKGLSVNVYAKPEFSWIKMQKMRLFLENNLNPDKTLKEQVRYGYKAFNRNMTCRGFQFEEGKVFKEKYKPVLYSRGFHFCLKLVDCFNFYSRHNCIIHKVEILGDVKGVKEPSMCCTNKIKILERVYDSENVGEYL